MIRQRKMKVSQTRSRTPLATIAPENGNSVFVPLPAQHQSTTSSDPAGAATNHTWLVITDAPNNTRYDSKIIQKSAGMRRREQIVKLELMCLGVMVSCIIAFVLAAVCVSGPFLDYTQ